MSAMQAALDKMVEEYKRVKEFNQRFAGYNHADPAQGRAVITTPVVIIGTLNHGVFELDHQEIIAILEKREKDLEKELKDRTLLGEDISKLRVNKDAE